KSRFRNSRCSRQSADHEHGSGGVEECSGGLEGCLDVLGEPAISVDPCEEAFNDPPPRQDDEAGLPGDFADDFNGDAGSLRDALMVVAAIGPYLLDKGEQAA